MWLGLNSSKKKFHSTSHNEWTKIHLTWFPQVSQEALRWIRDMWMRHSLSLMFYSIPIFHVQILKMKHFLSIKCRWCVRVFHVNFTSIIPHSLSLSLPSFPRPQLALHHSHQFSWLLYKIIIIINSVFYD